MAPPLLFDVSKVDPDRAVHDEKFIEKINPHRGAMRMLDRIVYQSDDNREWVAVKDVRDDEFWVPGHIPGRPIFPGVLMIEAAAQLASFIGIYRFEGKVEFMGFAAVDDVKFRGQVRPGDQFVLLAQELEFRPRRCISRCQGLVDNQLVFEGTVTGMPM